MFDPEMHCIIKRTRATKQTEARHRQLYHELKSGLSLPRNHTLLALLSDTFWGPMRSPDLPVGSAPSGLRLQVKLNAQTVATFVSGLRKVDSPIKSETQSRWDRRRCSLENRPH